jgi:hypothetical protein
MESVKDEPDNNLDLFGEQNLDNDFRELFSPNQSPHLSYAVADNLGGGSHQLSPPPQAISVKQEHGKDGNFMEMVPTNGSHRSSGVPPLSLSGTGSSSAAQKRGANVIPHPQSPALPRPPPHPNPSSSRPNWPPPVSPSEMPTHKAPPAFRRPRISLPSVPSPAAPPRPHPHPLFVEPVPEQATQGGAVDPGSPAVRFVRTLCCMHGEPTSCPVSVYLGAPAS